MCARSIEKRDDEEDRETNRTKSIGRSRIASRESKSWAQVWAVAR